MIVKTSKTTVQESVVNYARKAKEAGLDGVVCSAQEVELIKAATAEDFLCVTPGIRQLDQKSATKNGHDSAGSPSNRQ